MGLREIDPGGGAVDGADKADINANFRELFSMWSEFTAISSIGGILVRMVNDTGAHTVKGKIVDASRNVDNAIRLTQVDVPDTIGVMFEDGVAQGAYTWIVIAGLAEVYYTGSVTRGWLARSANV